MGRVCWVSLAVVFFVLGALLLTAGLVIELSVFNSIVHSSMKKVGQRDGEKEMRDSETGRERKKQGHRKTETVSVTDIERQSDMETEKQKDSETEIERQRDKDTKVV